MASVSEKKRLARLKQQKKLGIQPVSQFVISRDSKIDRKERDRFTSQYPLVLMDIESTIVEFFQSHPQLDDRITAIALDALVKGSSPADPLAQQLCEQFESMDQTKIAIRNKGIRSILTSIDDRSTMRSGERSYLNFAVTFVSRYRHES